MDKAINTDDTRNSKFQPFADSTSRIITANMADKRPSNNGPGYTPEELATIHAAMRVSNGKALMFWDAASRSKASAT